MPAINPLSTTTTLLPVLNIRSEAASRLTSSIVNVSDSPQTLVRHKRAENTGAHNLAYSAYLPAQHREKRDNQGNIPYGTYSEHTCYKVLNKLQQGEPLVDTLPYPPAYQRIYDEYQRVITSADCKHYITTTTTPPPCGKMKEKACKPRQLIESADDYISRMEICNSLKNCEA